MELAEVIKGIRRDRKLSQRALADLVKVSRGAVAQWETGATTPTVANMMAIAEALDFPLQGQVSMTGPYQGKFVDDPDELALLRFWGKLSRDQRAIMLGMLKAFGATATVL